MGNLMTPDWDCNCRKRHQLVVIEASLPRPKVKLRIIRLWANSEPSAEDPLMSLPHCILHSPLPDVLLTRTDDCWYCPSCQPLAMIGHGQSIILNRYHEVTYCQNRELLMPWFSEYDHRIWWFFKRGNHMKSLDSLVINVKQASKHLWTSVTRQSCTMPNNTLSNPPN